MYGVGGVNLSSVGGIKVAVIIRVYQITRVEAVTVTVTTCFNYSGFSDKSTIVS